jgi:hypothetical protein
VLLKVLHDLGPDEPAAADDDDLQFRGVAHPSRLLKNSPFAR